ncbi:hypothetical protein OsI_37050 [Oryza sativa Indica Group]|uniref:Uncharacterized protein n=1 Tax=Oryza sativa subsp. indica TaxID=39946 RepID=B8BIK5_ORYSI|nr:hypothetical protein OsI_37050 [Oryza sativa Indica Group]
MQAFQIPIRVFERFWRTIEAYACQPFTGHDNGRKNPTSPHARKAMVERWPADEGGRRHRRFFLPPPAAAQGVEKEVVGAVAVRPGEQGVGGDDAGAGEQGGGDGRGLDLATVRSLNGVRVADEILWLVPDAAAFHTTLRCVKESTSCSEDSTAPRRRIIRRRLAASKESRRQRQREREAISAAAASTPRISGQRGRRGRSGGEDIDRPAPHPVNASASVRFSANFSGKVYIVVSTNLFLSTSSLKLEA